MTTLSIINYFVWVLEIATNINIFYNSYYTYNSIQLYNFINLECAYGSEKLKQIKTLFKQKLVKIF